MNELNSPCLPPRLPQGEREPEEGERRVLMLLATPVPVLAVHDPGLVGMQPQPDVGHPRRERGQHLLCLPLGHAMHDRVVGVPLELHRWELAR